MHESWIFGSMLAAGFALFATAAKIEADRNAFTNLPVMPEPAQPLRTTVSSLKIAAAPPSVERDDYVVQLPQVEITGRRPRAQLQMSEPQSVQSQLRLATEPCSQWQEIGPERVDDGSAIGVRRVRSLCLGPMSLK